ncbi:MAG: hypothetical protein PHG00_10835 [Methylococcales bacterium]|nr:hypothetical protein [Methylococcales bacterium]
MRAEQDPAAVSASKRAVLNLSDQDELTRLRKENERLRRERELLKKAAGIEAKEVE